VIRNLWNDLWPNAVAPSIWTILAIVIAHIRTRRLARRNHEDLKRHVTKETQ
jgi:hypothetical protein